MNVRWQWWVRLGLAAGVFAGVVSGPIGGVRVEAAPVRKAVGAPEADKVGLVERDFTPAAGRNWRGATRHRLHVLVWYPAVDTAVETPQFVPASGAPLFEAGSATPHAPFAPAMEGLPLIVLSHGSGGSAEQMGWLGTALARAGFMAVAVEHPGNNSAGGTMSAEGMALWWERATDLSEVLDGLLADPELGAHVDRDRIGVAGYSLGGYTALEMGGARTDIAAFFDRCAHGGDLAVCHLAEKRGMGTPEQMLAAVRKTSGESLARSGDSFRDPRVKAVFAMAPALGFTLTPESLHAMRLPVEMVVGSADPIAPAAENASFVGHYIRGARVTVLPGVSHYTFLDVCTAAGKKDLPLYCSDEIGVDRAAVHEGIAGMASEFFAKVFRLR